MVEENTFKEICKEVNDIKHHNNKWILINNRWTKLEPPASSTETAKQQEELAGKKNKEIASKKQNQQNDVEHNASLQLSGQPHPHESKPMGSDAVALAGNISEQKPEQQSEAAENKEQAENGGLT